MPLLKIVCSQSPKPEVQRRVLAALSKKLAAHLEKPESYVMTCWSPDAPMTFAGTEEPACFVEIKSIGTMTSAQTAAMSADVCQVIADATGVLPARIYIEFSDAKPHLWGHDGSNFA